MEPAEYDVMAAAEDSLWWYRGLRRLVIETLEWAFPRGGPERIVDVGCGTGGCYVVVRDRFPTVRYVGIDPEPKAIAYCRARGLRDVIRASASEIPLRCGSADAVICLDVLYYPSVRPAAAMRDFYEVLKPGGVLILNLPAFESLRGQHDVAVTIPKRYRLREARSLCEGAGFRIARATYWNATFFLPLVVWRRLSRSKRDAIAHSDVDRSPPWLNALFHWVLSLELGALRWVALPFGSSAFVVARKPSRASCGLAC